MRLFEWLKKRRKQKMRDQLANHLCNMRKTDNQGLLLKQLISISEVRRYVLESGGMRRASCDVTMHDGYTLCGYEYWAEDAVKDAIYKVVERLKEKHEL